MPLQSSFSLNTTNPIPARSGVAVPLTKGQTITIINTHGTQVVDFWCFAQPSSTSSSSSSTTTFPLSHHLSLPHTRASLNRLSPLPSDTLTTNHRTPILTLLTDTSPHVHDTLIAACDIYRYRELAHKPASQFPEYYHANCADNCRDALLALSTSGISPALQFEEPQLQARKDFTPPAPLNLWMNIPVHPKGGDDAEGKWGPGSGPSCGASLSFERPVSKAGDEVVLRAEMDVVAVMSACPQDLLEINCGKPVGCEFVVREG